MRTASARILGVTRVMPALLAAALLVPSPASPAGETDRSRPSGIVLMIGDGMGASHLTAALIEAGRLDIERMPTGGLVKTFPGGGLVTDSAASATAYATGYRTLNGMISISPGGDTLRTVLEVAEDLGLRTGLVATSSITHATPAAFAAHVESRTMDAEIAGQIARSGVDVIIGGGRGWFLPAGTVGSRRKDDLDLISVLESGPGVAGTLDELRGMKDGGGGVLFLADGHCPDVSGREHSLAKLTTAALEILAAPGDGFFLMVEGSQIDWEAHDGDTGGIIAEMIDFDEAVGAALDFAEDEGDVLVIVTSDHETGGFSVLDGSIQEKRVDRAVFGTGDHTAAMVPIFASGPGSSRFSGILDNIEIGRRLIGMLTGSGPPEGAPEIAGDWSGVLSFSGLELMIVFHIERDGKGGWTATMDSPDQGAEGIPASRTAVVGDSVVVEVAVAMGRFEGRFEPDSIAIDGLWKQSGYEIPLRLTPQAGGAARSRPQEPVRPLPYREEEVSFPGGGEGVVLAGTITIPEGDGPFPGAVLLTGSGPQDRDETVLGHRPFLVLSDHLTREGIAVLRFDDRGVGGSTAGEKPGTTEDFAADAAAALRFISSIEEIEGSRAGFIGHSEGGLTGPMAEVRYGGAAFVVMLAGPGLPGSDILIEQNRLLLRSMGASEELVDTYSRQLEEEYRVLTEGTGGGETAEEILRVSTGYLERYSPEERERFDLNEEAFSRRAAILATPWFRFFISYDPAPALSRLECPVLALFGGKDMQVEPESNSHAVREALEAGGNGDITVRVLPGLNHLFQTAGTGMPTEYASIEETVSPVALEAVSSWILERFASSGAGSRPPADR